MTKLGNLNLHISSDAESAAKEAALRVQEHIENARAQNKAILFLTSGGSAFAILRYLPEDTFENDITIGTLDERFDPTNETNQFSQLLNTKFYDVAVRKKSRFIDTSVKEGQTHKTFATEFEEKLHSWRESHPSTAIIATIGMGPDGHISGIMPFAKDPARFNKLFAGDNWVANYDATGKNPYPLRTTTTLTFLKAIDRPVVYVTGSQKAHALSAALQDGPIAEIPARFLLTLPGDIYIDEALSQAITHHIK